MDEVAPTATIAGSAAVVVPEDEAGIPANLEVDVPWERESVIADSAMGEDQHTVTTSVTPSVRDFRHEGGRRYHAFEEDAYFLPNDEVEAGRLDLQHYIWKLTFDGALCMVPYSQQIKKVLDVGTGTGIWAMDYAEAHPLAQVFGTDLSPIQPDFVPPNCAFIVDNAEYDWVFDIKFDYIHSRMLTLGIHDWKRYFQQCWDNLAPGGWVETGETQFPQGSVDADTSASPFISWGNHVVSAAQKVGIDLQASERFSSYLEELGFVNIERVNVQWPIRPWAKGRKNKVIGRVMYSNTCKGIPAVNSLLSRHLGWTQEELDENEKRCVEDLDRGHYYSIMVCHRAQKPMNAS